MRQIDRQTEKGLRRYSKGQNFVINAKFHRQPVESNKHINRQTDRETWMETDKNRQK